MKFIAKLEKKKETWFLIAILFIFFLLRIPSLFEPYWYGDEGVYEVIGMAIHQGRNLYSGIWDNKPPFLYLIYAIFNGDQTSVRFISLIFGLFSVIFFFFLSKKLFQQRKIVFSSTTIFALLFATPFLEGNIANAENFMILPILISALFVFSIAEHTLEKKKFLKQFQNTNYRLFYSGFLLGIAFLIKVVAIFDFAAFFFFLFLKDYKNIKSFSTQFAKLFSISLGFITPIAFTFLFYFIRGEMKVFLFSAFTSNFNYVDYENKFFIPHGFLILKLTLLLAFLILLFFKRRNISRTIMFVLLWTGFSFFNVFFSQRPYTHYVLTFIASLSLYIALCVYTNKTRKFYILLGLLLIILVNNQFSLYTRIYKNIFSYYDNFFSFIFQQETTSSYLKFFDPITVRDYALSSYISMHKQINDKLFVWGDSAQIYKMTNTLPPGRFIVTYHITMSKENILETGLALLKTQPKYIIILPKQPIIPYSLVRYQPKLSIQNAIIYEKVF